MNRFQINPGPLKIVPASRRAWPTARNDRSWDVYMQVRCEAETRDHGRCTRVKANDSERYCWQHKR